jgi:DNA polymerase
LNKLEFITAFRALLSYHRSCGIEAYPAGDSAESGLDVLTQLAGDPSQISGPPAPQRPEAEKTGESGDGVQEKAKLLTMKELEAEVSRCRICPLHLERQISTAGTGGTRSIALKLMIVGDWLTVTRQSPGKVGDIFGRDQDLMLARMIEAIDLTRDEVFITNVIKCSISEMCQPISDHIRSCSNYLEMQIELLSPQLICSMGIIASRLLTSQARPLSQQRGHFYSYKTGSGLQIPVMPTYHPTFLLQNPEMKQATWADLQAIKQKLGG